MHIETFTHPGFSALAFQDSEAQNGINGPKNEANEWPFNCSQLKRLPVVEDESRTPWVVIISGGYLIIALF